jgi:hypothetical protein
VRSATANQGRSNRIRRRSAQVQRGKLGWRRTHTLAGTCHRATFSPHAFQLSVARSFAASLPLPARHGGPDEANWAETRNPRAAKIDARSSMKLTPSATRPPA